MRKWTKNFAPPGIGHNPLGGWMVLILLTMFVYFHILGVVYTSIHHRENLPGAMLHGRKRE